MNENIKKSLVDEGIQRAVIDANLEKTIHEFSRIARALTDITLVTFEQIDALAKIREKVTKITEKQP